MSRIAADEPPSSCDLHTHEASVILREKPKITVYSPDHETFACPAIRILLPFQHLKWEVEWGTRKTNSGTTIDIDAARSSDIIVIQRHFPSAETEKALRSILGHGIPIVFDIDDALFDAPEHHPLHNYLNARAPYIKWILREADLITASTLALGRSLANHTRREIVVNPNIVDWTLFSSTPKRQTGAFNFLIAGTATHHRDWSIIETALSEILRLYEGRVNAVFFGEIPHRFASHPGCKFVTFQSGYHSYAKTLRELFVHAALVPLEDSKFNRCKSNIKWLEYSAAGIPCIFSNIPPYSSCVVNGETGLLVDNTVESWISGMKHILTYPDAAISMINNARKVTYESHSVQTSSMRYAEPFLELIGKKHTHHLFSRLPTFSALARTTFRRFIDRNISWRFNRQTRD